MTRTLSEEREPTNVVWVGDGGSGKTTALATMARRGRVLLVNAESGVKARALRSHGIPIENIEIFPDPDEDEQITYEALESEWLRLRELLHEDPDAYVGVGWDSVTEIQKTLAEVERKQAIDKADRKGLARDPWTMDQDNRVRVNEQVRQLIRNYRDLPCHFGMTALMRREQDDDGAVTYQPGVSPGLQGDIVGWMDIVCWTFVADVGGEDEYRGLFKPHGKYRGKDRFRALPKWLVDPTFERIDQYVAGELVVGEDPVMRAARARAERVKAEPERDQSN